MKSYKPLNPFPENRTPRVLLLGNGFNRSFEKDGWSSYLKNLTGRIIGNEEKPVFEAMPFPLRIVYLSGDKVDQTFKKQTGDVKTILGEDQAELQKQFLNQPFEAVLTTNYSYELEKTICPVFSCKYSRANSYRKKTCEDGGKNLERFLYRYYDFRETGYETPIWHIHGEEAIPDSIVLGHYYYGKLISSIQQYLPVFFRRYNMSKKQGKPYIPHSWVDYFMTGDVFIVGQGLDFSEADLWWLINCKKRYGINNARVDLFDPEGEFVDRSNEIAREARHRIAETYSVKVKTGNYGSSDYLDYYRQVAQILRTI